jgi:hypothetical protein
LLERKVFESVGGVRMNEWIVSVIVPLSTGALEYSRQVIWDRSAKETLKKIVSE